MKTIPFFSLLLTSFLSGSVFAFVGTEAVPKSNQGTKDEQHSQDFSAIPGLVTDGDIILLPSITVSFEDAWLHWTENKGTGKKSKFWKHRFSSSIALNGEIDAEDNEDLIQKYMSNGGNVNVDFKLGITAFGATYDGFSAYLFGKYAYLDTKEFTTETDTQTLNLETAQYGLGLGVKFRKDFYLGWEGGRATILGNENEDGAFYQSIDDEILQRLTVVWSMDKEDASDPATYIQFFRSWGAKDTDAKIGLAVSKSFDIGN